MSDTRKGWVGSMLSSLEDAKIRTGSPDNVVPLITLSKLHETARRARANLAAIDAEGHSLMLRRQEALDQLRSAQQSVIEAIGEIGIRGSIVEPST